MVSHFFSVQKPTFLESISGILGILPSDIINTIVASSLALPTDVSVNCREEVLETAYAVQSFVRTCRGAADCVHADHRVEAMARCKVLLTPRHCKLQLDHQSYTRTMMHSVRIIMEYKLLVRLLKNNLSHCAFKLKSCCRGTRNLLNESLKYIELGKTPERSALAKASLGNRKNMNVGVVAESESAMLCLTDGGVAVLSNGRVFCTEGRHSGVFCPYADMERTFDVSVGCKNENVISAASEGSLLSIVTKNEHEDEFGIALCTIRTWDTERGVLLDSRKLGALNWKGVTWINLGFVYCATLNEKGGWTVSGDGQLYVEYFHPESEELSAQKIGGCWRPPTSKFDKDNLSWGYPELDRPNMNSETVVPTSISVSKNNNGCGLAYILTEVGFDWPKTEKLTYFDQIGPNCGNETITRVCEIHCYQGSSHNRLSIVRVSPAGDVMVVLRRVNFNDNQSILIYTRPLNERTKWGLGWGIAARSWSTWCGANLCWPISNSIFSPCGGIVCFFYRSPSPNEQGGTDQADTNEAGVMTIDVCASIENRQVIASDTQTPHVSSPLNILWGDGIFLSTAIGDGIVRVGSI